MAKISVVVLADTETHADLGRMLNALELVKEEEEDGRSADIPFLSEFEGHPSLRQRIADGFTS